MLVPLARSKDAYTRPRQTTKTTDVVEDQGENEINYSEKTIKNEELLSGLNDSQPFSTSEGIEVFGAHHQYSRLPPKGL